MLELSGTYGDIIYLPPFGGYDPVEARKTIMKAAERANRVDEISFMSGSMMGQRTTDTSEFIKLVGSAQDAGDKYYLISLPRDETGLETIRKFAKEVIPSFK